MFVWFSFGSVHLSWSLSCRWMVQALLFYARRILRTIDFWTYWSGMYS